MYSILIVLEIYMNHTEETQEKEVAISKLAREIYHVRNTRLKNYVVEFYQNVENMNDTEKPRRKAKLKQ